ncbi:MAG: trimeric intracellular cation channel family protein [Bacteroidota bacterium]|nr:trimeric intracellular cation channel family protein [Bacteroidota bacterium]MDP4205120.1 trimeric intracellular cation channel family protein [Bacteroidota bacterium]
MDFIYWFDILGTFVFAISGTLAAGEKQLDLFGAVFIGFVTAIGGGTLRDVMIGVHPVSWICSMDYFYAIVLAVGITFFFKDFVLKLRHALFLFDTIGIGVFTIIGLEKALSYGINMPIAVIMGILTAVAGGIIRDTLNNEVPLIFHKEIYATACLLGALCFLLFQSLGLNVIWNQLITILIIILIRIASIKYNLSLPHIEIK